MKTCANCSASLKRHQYKYCSNTCQQAKQRFDWIKRWLDGDPTLKTAVYNGIETSEHIHRWMRETYGDKCSVCGWADVHPVTGKVPVQLDHIDGDALNNQPDNLRLLCPNHHSLTPTYGGLNRGKGRAARYA